MFILTIGIMISILGVSQAAHASALDTFTTTTVVNLRTGPSTNYSVIRTLASNTSVTVLENQANGWSRVSQNGTIGFIRSDLLSVSAAGTSAAPSSNQRTVAGVNMRSGPAITYSVIRLLPVNTNVDVLESRANGWSRVRHNGTVGFIRSDFLTTVGAELSDQQQNIVRDGNTAAAVWNLIIAQQMPGISDRPEHVAGIIGNMQVEIGLTLCPFQQQANGNRAGIGLLQWSHGRRTNLENFMWRNGVSQEEFRREMNRHLNHTCTGVCKHPPDLLDRVLELQVQFMFYELRNNTWERNYMNFIDSPSSTTGIAGARAYAELFCVLALRPGSGRTNGYDDIVDEGVIEARRMSLFGGAGNLDRTSFSRLQLRRDRAEHVFNQFYGDYNED